MANATAAAQHRPADVHAAAAHYSIRVLWSEEDGAFVAVCPEFPGLSGQADTEADAINELREALEMALEELEESGQVAPAPHVARDDYSGQIRLRMPKTLHEAMAHRAEEEGVSLNTLAVTYLSRGLA